MEDDYDEWLSQGSWMRQALRDEPETVKERLRESGIEPDDLIVVNYSTEDYLVITSDARVLEF